MKLIFATHNQGKIKEMKDLLNGFGLEIMSASEAGVEEEAVEDGDTFAENALKKARFVNQRTGAWTVADDSGLCVASLNGAPGVHSARWGGEGVIGEKLVELALEKMKNIPAGRRQAYFESALALISPLGEESLFNGRIDGEIAEESRGQASPKLPYDLIFVPEGDARTFAEMSPEEKNSISHRGRAFEKLKEYLATII